MSKARNQKLGIILFIFSIIYIYSSFQLPSYAGVPVDADVIPIALGFLLIILSIFLFFSKDSEEEKEKQERVIPEKKKDLLMLLVVALFIFIYIWLLERAGFLITTILFIFTTTLVLGYRKHITNLIVSVSIPVIFYFTFSHLLEIVLPKGILPF